MAKLSRHASIKTFLCGEVDPKDRGTILHVFVINCTHFYIYDQETSFRESVVFGHLVGMNK